MSDDAWLVLLFFINLIAFLTNMPANKGNNFSTGLMCISMLAYGAFIGKFLVTHGVIGQ